MKIIRMIAVVLVAMSAIITMAACGNSENLEKIQVQSIQSLTSPNGITQADITVLIPELEAGTKVYLDFAIDDQSVPPDVMENSDPNYQWPRIGGQDCLINDDHTCQQTIFYLKQNISYYIQPQIRLNDGKTITTSTWTYFKTK